MELSANNITLGNILLRNAHFALYKAEFNPLESEENPKMNKDSKVGSQGENTDTGKSEGKRPPEKGENSRENLEEFFRKKGKEMEEEKSGLKSELPVLPIDSQSVPTSLPLSSSADSTVPDPSQPSTIVSVLIKVAQYNISPPPLAAEDYSKLSDSYSHSYSRSYSPGTTRPPSPHVSLYEPPTTSSSSLNPLGQSTTGNPLLNVLLTQSNPTSLSLTHPTSYPPYDDVSPALRLPTFQPPSPFALYSSSPSPSSSTSNSSPHLPYPFSNSSISSSIPNNFSRSISPSLTSPLRSSDSIDIMDLFGGQKNDKLRTQLLGSDMNIDYTNMKIFAREKEEVVVNVASVDSKDEKNDPKTGVINKKGNSFLLFSSSESRTSTYKDEVESTDIIPPLSCTCQYLRELKAIIALAPHPNIITLFGVTLQPMCLIFEKMDAGNLVQNMEREEWQVSLFSLFSVLIIFCFLLFSVFNY